MECTSTESSLIDLPKSRIVACKVEKKHELLESILPKISHAVEALQNLSASKPPMFQV